MSSSEGRLPTWALPVGLVLVVAALIVIALARGPTTLDPDTPEGTVQEYLMAINEERFEDAISVVHEDWRGTCEATDIEAAADTDFTAELGGQTGFGASRFSAAEGPIAVPEDATSVEVTITHDNGGLGGGWSEVVVFDLVDDGDFWWLVGDPWPYFAWSCQGVQ